MTKTQIIRFIENEDSSAITFKRFNQSPEDKYPTFSLCFKGAPLSWYHDDLIFSRFGLTSSRYAKTLEGKQTYKYNYNYTARLYKKIPIQTNDVVTEDVDKFYLNSSNIWKDVDYATEHEQGATDDIQAITEKQIPFFLGYKTPDTICFTRNAVAMEHSMRSYDYVSLNQDLLANGKYEAVQLKIFSHYPGQLLRSFHKPVFDSTLGSIRDEFNSRNHFHLKISLSQVMALKKRPDANIACDDDLIDDDLKLQMEIMKRTQCIPIYWKDVAKDRLNLNPCLLSSDYAKANYLIQHYKKVLRSYDSPCVEMIVSAKVESEKKHASKEAAIKFIYVEPTYQEISNDKVFGLESFISGVGGFIGIFVGYSLLQIPELLEQLISMIKKHRTKKYSVAENAISPENGQPENNGVKRGQGGVCKQLHESTRKISNVMFDVMFKMDEPPPEVYKYSYYTRLLIYEKYI